MHTIGTNIRLTLAGESHSEAITVILDGLPAGVPVDEVYMRRLLSLRRPQNALSTGRAEADEFRILGGVRNGFTCGTPVCILIPNTDAHSEDYAALQNTPRPGHADYTNYVKNGQYAALSGGGAFSGRLTVGIVAAGAIALSALKQKNIRVLTHIHTIGGVQDTALTDFDTAYNCLSASAFPVLSESAGEEMRETILLAKTDCDSVGGILETVIDGVPAGVGAPWFDSVESVLSHMLFSIPAVKGVEFGDGFALASMRGSEANDAFCMENGVRTVTNHCGGILGGLSDGMPIVFRTAIKPTPSIAKSQQTVDLQTGESTMISVGGRHDPCIVPRAAVVVRCAAAICILDLLG